MFFSTPGEPAYESDFEEPMRMDLKRHVQGSRVRRDDDPPSYDKRSLFDKYQFFTPGTFLHSMTAWDKC